MRGHRRRLQFPFVWDTDANVETGPPPHPLGPRAVPARCFNKVAMIDADGVVLGIHCKKRPAAA